MGWAAEGAWEPLRARLGSREQVGVKAEREQRCPHGASVELLTCISNKTKPTTQSPHPGARGQREPLQPVQAGGSSCPGWPWRSWASSRPTASYREAVLGLPASGAAWDLKRKRLLSPMSCGSEVMDEETS